MMQELRFHPPPDFNIGRCLKILPAPTFSPLSCIFSTASSHIQDAFPPNPFLSTPIWFWIMFLTYLPSSACHCFNNLLLYENLSPFLSPCFFLSLQPAMNPDFGSATLTCPVFSQQLVIPVSKPHILVDFQLFEVQSKIMISYALNPSMVGSWFHKRNEHIQ